MGYDNGSYRTFDLILKAHLERVVKNGRNNLVFLDIGSGEGQLLNEVSRGQDINESVKFITDNPRFKLTLIGLTDAPDSSHQGQKAHVYESQNNQILAINYFYSLHRTQPLSSFLNGINVYNIDLVFASECFQYLNSDVFKEVTNTASDRLVVGGQLIASGYYDVPSGFTPFGDKFNFINKKKLQPWQELIKQLDATHHPHVVSKIFFDSLTPKELQIASMRAIELFSSFGVIDDTKSRKIISDINNNSIEWVRLFDVYGRPVMNSLILDILCDALEQLYNKKNNQETEKKNQFLRQIKNVDLSWFDHSSRGFILTKK